MDIQAILNIFLVDFPVITTLLVTLLFGEEAVIMLGFFSGIGLLSLWILFVFGFIGTLLSDLLWFIVGKKAFKEKNKPGEMHTRYHKFMRHIDRIATNNLFLALFFTRFFYFFRLFAIVHISRLGMSYKRFLVYEIPLISIWLVAFMAIGFLFGNIAITYLESFENINKIIFIAVIALIGSLILKSIISRKIEKS